MKDFREEIVELPGDDHPIRIIRNAYGPEKQDNPFGVNLSCFYNGSVMGTMPYHQVKIIEAVNPYSNQKTRHWLLIKTSLIQGYVLTVTR